MPIGCPSFMAHRVVIPVGNLLVAVLQNLGVMFLPADEKAGAGVRLEASDTPAFARRRSGEKEQLSTKTDIGLLPGRTSSRRLMGICQGGAVSQRT